MAFTIGGFFAMLFSSWWFFVIIAVVAGVVIGYVVYDRRKKTVFHGYAEIREYYGGTVSGMRSIVPDVRCNIDTSSNDLIFIDYDPGTKIALPNMSEYMHKYKGKWRVILYKTANDKNCYYPAKESINLKDVDNNGTPDIFESPIKTDNQNWFVNMMKDKARKYRPVDQMYNLLKMGVIVLVALLIGTGALTWYVSKTSASLTEDAKLIADQTNIALERQNDILEANLELLKHYDITPPKEQTLNSNKPPD